MSESPLRAIPSVRALIEHPHLADLRSALGRDELVRVVRETLESLRVEIREAGDRPVDLDRLLDLIRIRTETGPPRLRPVINATGILLNTGLGRAPLGVGAMAEVARAASGYCNLEFDLQMGTRDDRTTAVADLLRRLTGAEAATVVNNNAAATVLTLRALAQGREVVVSRGQLVEIGGSFRLPEIFEASGAKLREVGTTNKTRLADYARAIGPETAALMRVHPSNYRIVGFTESVGIAALAGLARDRGIACIDDIGSGLLRRDLLPGLADEPTVEEGIKAGADIVLFSGDKLLGGPQAGLIVGRKRAVDRIASDPLMRALRVDKMTIAGLEATLRHARSDGQIPLWDLLNTSVDVLQHRAEAIAHELVAAGFSATVESSEAMLGGGSDPARPIASRAIRLAPPYPGPIADWSEGDLARGLRIGCSSVVARVQAGAVLIDLRALFAEQDGAVVSAFAGIITGVRERPF